MSCLVVRSLAADRDFFIQIHGQNNLDPGHAIIEASQRRLRPILLTTATTVGGLLPLWIGGGPMWETMAIAIIFGLLFSTGLSLGVVPVLYAVFFKVKVDQNTKYEVYS